MLSNFFRSCYRVGGAAEATLADRAGVRAVPVEPQLSKL